MDEKKGIISDIIYYNEENSYIVAVVENDEEMITAVGYLPNADKGRAFSFFGDWKVHPTYGEQFHFTEYREELPQSREGIINFLSSGVLKGIGPKIAANIVNRFGEDTLKIISETPNRLTEIDGIGAVKAQSISEAFQGHREFAEIVIFLQQYGINASYAMKLYKIYKSDTIEVVKENPYKLVDDIFGIGFRTADRIASKIGISKDSCYRIGSGIKYILGYYISEGHTFIPKSFLTEKASEMLEVSMELIGEELIRLALEGDIHMEQLDNRTVVFPMAYYYAETNVCKNLIRLNEADLKPVQANVDELISITEHETGIELAEKQKNAVKSSLANGVCVITGGPGTGKTTTINTIIKIFEISGLKTAIAAPTGRAAKRITETTGYEAKTIHRLLEYYFSEDEEMMRFGKNEEDTLDFDAIIIDEASMVDILLMNGLLKAIVPGTRLIIVGDADQLPSVGAGNVLRDIIDSEIIYSVKLDEIFRQAKESMIIVNAHRINKGEYPYCNEKDKDFYLLRKNNEKVMLETIKELCLERLPKYYQSLDPVKDVQILTPVRKGLLGSLNLNNEMQKILNPPAQHKKEKIFKEKLFREGDKVMQIKNNYSMDWKRLEDFSEGQGVFNGDVGYIQTIDLEYNQMTVVFEENKVVQYGFIQADELELAYAVTVHKSQGSEFPIIIMPVSWFPPMLATRNLLYTAVTRAKKVVVLVGSDRFMNAMVDNNRIVERYSGLASRLKMFLDIT